MKKKQTAALALLLFATTWVYAEPNAAYESVAVADSAAGGFVNPAVLSFGNGTGLGFIKGFDDKGFNGDFSAFFHTRVLGYAYTREREIDRHNLIFSIPLMRNLYFGTAINTESFSDQDTTWHLGLLYRPADFLSIGTKAILPPGSGENEARYLAGIALRPLHFTGISAKRMHLFADLPFSAEELLSPKIGIHIEPVDGLRVKFGYDLENQALGFSLDLAMGAIAAGSSVETDSSMNLQSGRASLQFSPQPFNSFRPPNSTVFYSYDFGPQIVETGQAIKTGPFYLVMDHHSLLDTLKELEKIGETPYIDGLVFINTHTAMSLSTLMELRDALEHLREKGKKIVFYGDYMTGTDYLLAASAGDEIYLHPRGMIDLKGISVSSPYFKDFFEKYGIEVVNINTGRYKSAYNFLSESSMPDAEREALDFMLEGIYAQYAELIEAGRGAKLKKDARESISDGPYLIAEEALKAGLVDELIQRDQLRERLVGGNNKAMIRDRIPSDFVRSDWSEPPSTKVALIHADGPIHTGSGIPGRTIGSETLTQSIKTAREDDRVEAILLRVNSGGGSALASDVIAREVELCRSGEQAKPLIVSMAGAAASGGYYISAFADRIVASPATLTGSIGVISIFPNFANLLEEHQITWEVVRKGPRADLGAMYRPLSEDERTRIRDFINHSYDRFLQVVGEGRSIPVEEVKEVAGGRVWTGGQALERGLVDKVGGYETALSTLMEEAGISGEVELVDYSYVNSWGKIALGKVPGMWLESILGNGAGNTLDPIAAKTIAMEMVPPEIEYLHAYYGTVKAPSGTSMMVMPYFVEGFSPVE